VIHPVSGIPRSAVVYAEPRQGGKVFILCIMVKAALCRDLIIKMDKINSLRSAVRADQGHVKGGGLIDLIDPVPIKQMPVTAPPIFRRA
jgi:hypothetical protein